MSLPPAFRFLTLIVGGWTALRAGMSLYPLPAIGPDPIPAASGSDRPARVKLAARTEIPLPQVKEAHPHFMRSGLSASLLPQGGNIAGDAALPLDPEAKRDFRSQGKTQLLTRVAGIPAQMKFDHPASTRWSAELWLLARDAGASDLPSPALGGSQIGGRIRYKLARSGAVSASLRFYAPADQFTAGDVAAGIDWRPVETVPVNILVERRQALGPDGRSAFALTAYGGISRVKGRATLDLYGQTGIVGAKSRDLFADGIATVRFRLDEGARFHAGAGAWAAAQPGVARVDIGPTIALRPAADAPVTIALDWRQRIAGNAAPRSGPVLTVAASF